MQMEWRCQALAAGAESVRRMSLIKPARPGTGSRYA